MTISLKTLKYLCAGISGIASLIGCGLIFCIRKPHLISFAESLTGGALLGAAFSHLFQDSANDIFLYGKMIYPISGAIAISTFVILTIIEIFSYSEPEKNEESSHIPAKGPASFHKKPSHISIQRAVSDNIEKSPIPAKRTASFNVRPHHDSFMLKNEEIAKAEQKEDSMVQDSQIQGLCDPSDDNTQQFENSSIQTNLISEDNLKTDTNLPRIEGKESSSDDSSSEIFGNEPHCFSFSITILYIIMIIRSFIEGLALGVVTNYNGVIALICAICGYKPLESFSLSLILSRDKPIKWLYWVMIIVYAIMTPVGAIAAIFISEVGDHLVLGIISAISVGTFAFMGCDEWSKMLENKEIWGKKDKTYHLGLFLLGIAWMLLIAIINY